jgi:YVTN family beta-propeller protein
MSTIFKAHCAPLAALVLCTGASLSPAAVAAAPVPAYDLSAHIALGQGKRWDYLTFDAATQRLYLAHADKVEVVDVATRARVGTISGLRGSHGVAVAPALGRGYISDGKADAVVIFDLRTLAVLRTVPVGKNPDAIVYDPVTGRVAVFNGASRDASILDAATGDVLTVSLPLGGKPEFARVDGAGHAYLNIEDTAEVVDVDLGTARVRGRYSIAPCEEPTGLAIGPAHQLISVCHNHIAVISDPASARVLGTAPIGEHPDGVVFDDGYAFSANGGDGSISVVPVPPASSGPAASIPSRRTARTIDVDPATHALYLPSLASAGTARATGTGAPSAAAAGGNQNAESDEIEILVFTRR